MDTDSGHERFERERMEQSYKRVRRIQKRKKGKGKKEERRKEIGERIGEKVEVEARKSGEEREGAARGASGPA